MGSSPILSAKVSISSDGPDVKGIENSFGFSGELAPT